MTQINFADLFEVVADTVPDREAVVLPDRRLTYAELDVRANRIAHHLHDAGIRAGDWVGLYLYNGTEYLEAMLGCYKIRAVPVNVNYRYVEDELRYLFDDAGLKALVAHREFMPRIAAVRPSCPDLGHVVAVDDGSDASLGSVGAVDYEKALVEASDAREFAPRSPDDLYVLYTGGTTGMPKGVLWRQEDAFFACFRGGNALGAPSHSADEMVAAIHTKGVAMSMFVVPPLMHGAAQWATYMSFYSGDRVVLDSLRTFDPDSIWRRTAAEKANSMVIVGDAMGRPLAEALAVGDYDLSSFFVLGSGGAILSDTVKEQLRTHLPNILILDSFGVSETGFQGQRASAAGADAGGPRFTMDATTSALGDDLRPITPGSGELGRLARTGHIPLGYHGDERKTAATFVTDPDGRRWALPGDMATVEADGTIVLLGRGNQCINTGGEKVFPEEVESVLKAYPDVFDVIVVGVPDARWGSRVTAVVQARPGTGATLTLKDLEAHCREHLAGYKVPRSLVVVDHVVRSPSGKPDYRWARSVAEPSS